MSTDVTVRVASDFSKYPSGRTVKDSRFSGDEFRQKFLTRPLQEKRNVFVYLDGVLGYGSSFIDQAFGGLRRFDNIPLKDLEDHLHIVTNYSDLKFEIWSVIRSA